MKVALHTKRNLVSRIASFEEDTGLELSLVSFMEYYQMGWDELYKSRKYSWNRLCVEAGVKEDFRNPREEHITKALSKLQFMNSRRWISLLISLIDDPLQLEERELTQEEEQMLLMFHYTVWGKSVADAGFSSLKESFLDLLENRDMMDEIRTILTYNYRHLHFVDHHVDLGFENPLDLHCRYTRDQILSGLGYYTKDKMPAQREGVLYLQEKNLDVFLVTLNKIEKDYSPTTLYNDYAINETLFHWQSQSTTSETSATGQRYIHHRDTNNRIILFVRENKKENGINGAPYFYLGKVNYVKHEGSKPMDVIWKLEEEMPAFLVKRSNRMVIG